MLSDLAPWLLATIGAVVVLRSGFDLPQMQAHPGAPRPVSAPTTAPRRRHINGNQRRILTTHQGVRRKARHANSLHSAPRGRGRPVGRIQRRSRKTYLATRTGPCMFHVKPGRIALHAILTIDLKRPPQGSGYQGGRNDRSQPRLADKPGRCGPMVTTRPVVSRETLRSSAASS